MTPLVFAEQNKEFVIKEIKGRDKDKNYRIYGEHI